MYKVPLRGSRIDTLGKQADLIPDARGADMGYPQTHIDRLRVCQCCEVVAMGFGNESDCCAVMNVERAPLDEQCIDCRVEPAVINDIVHVTIDIVVGPAGRDAAE